MVQIEQKRLKVGSSEPHDPPGNVAEAEQIHVPDILITRTSADSDIRELDVAAPEDIVEAEM